MTSLHSAESTRLDSVVSIRQDDLRRRLDQVESSIRALSGIDEALASRVLDRLEQGARSCRAAIDQADNQDGEPWPALAKIQREVDRVGQAVLTYTQGALLRRHGADEGFCGLADCLLDSFARAAPKLNWRGFAIPAESTFLGDTAEVVRLRFPGSTFWHLPVAAHEFGHFANPEIRVEQQKGSIRAAEFPVREFLESRSRGDNQRGWFHAHEYLADVFATFALGPSYLYEVLLLEVQPQTLRSASPTHPAWSDRLPLMLETLERMIETGGASTQVVDDLRRRWEAMLALSAGTRGVDLDDLHGYVDFLLPLLEQQLHELGYRSLRTSLRISHAMQRDQGQLSHASVPDVLNAAWLARMNNESNVGAGSTIAKRATAHLEVAS